VVKEKTPVSLSNFISWMVVPFSEAIVKAIGSAETFTLKLPDLTVRRDVRLRSVARGAPHDDCTSEPSPGTAIDWPSSDARLTGKTVSRTVYSLTGAIWISTS